MPRPACADDPGADALVVEVGVVGEQHRHRDRLSDQRGSATTRSRRHRPRRRTTGCRRAAGGRRDPSPRETCARSALRTSAWKSPAADRLPDRACPADRSPPDRRSLPAPSRCCVKAGKPLIRMSASTTTRKIAVRPMASDAVGLEARLGAIARADARSAPRRSARSSVRTLGSDDVSHIVPDTV